MQFELEATLSTPLVFSAPSPPLAYQAQPSSSTLEVQLGAVTRRVSDMVIAPEDAAPDHGLFTEPPPPIIKSPPPRKSPPKSQARAPSAPVRQSARQVMMNCSVPVAERAAFRIVRELGLLGPKDKMTVQAAEALIRRFKEPLTVDDIACIAKLTRLHEAALLVAAGLAGPDGAAIDGQ
ncbi:hypothetical protein CFC21_077550 [Triticum aestivum]|uniref:Uncharacterized protein n=2 Tax=Triticum aestivum TaxID=4565 RepID=A0A3B6MQ52_WHEAT|nr:hypothetical protein CFC21_077550 [Triticum aestivum]